MNRKFPLTALLLLLMACGNQDSPDADTPVGGAVAAEDRYNLQIVFHGLVAYAEDQDKVWAFLVDADYTDEDLVDGLPPEASLPPGVLKEIQSGDVVLHEFPAHFARLRLKNAKVVSGPEPDKLKGLPLSGADLRFQTGVRDLSVELSQLSRAGKISDARRQERQPDPLLLTALDELDSALIGDVVDSRLAARARIEAGTVQARLIDSCSGPGIKTKFSYQTLADGLACPGDPDDAVELAEEVVVTQTGVSQPTMIDLGGNLGQITITPDDPDQDLIIEVLNQTDRALNANDAEGCQAERHYGVFRWFYRLISGAGTSDTGNHLYPCPQRETLGDPKCPQKSLIISGGGS